MFCMSPQRAFRHWEEEEEGKTESARESSIFRILDTKDKKKWRKKMKSSHLPQDGEEKKKMLIKKKN